MTHKSKSGLKYISHSLPDYIHHKCVLKKRGKMTKYNA